ncbi:hypothetical protein IW261DRAFT_1462339 [Armillaria novae-zelandiae]|uniref:Secreted protein n=1 Tax=Armillaria novae-zelandiae TaxID=153914 RepID=A0AA39PFI4_9AGAR|nr:hypothetical protein IW261DRAFT_1462339 [Armillaria novae-zelandiae]
MHLPLAGFIGLFAWGRCWLNNLGAGSKFLSSCRAHYTCSIRCHCCREELVSLRLRLRRHETALNSSSGETAVFDSAWLPASISTSFE